MVLQHPQQTTLFLTDLVEQAIDALVEHEPSEGYYGGFSGGKDSCAIKELARLAGVKVEWHYHRTIDPPELVAFVRKHHPDVVFDKPSIHIFQDIKKKGMPWAKVRWCCAKLKEVHGRGRIKILGVRAAESPRRAAIWDLWDGKTLAPIVYWSDDDVWDFIRVQKLPYCSLYDEGFERLGCVGCPLAGQAKREMDFARWPRYETAWKKAAFQSNWNSTGQFPTKEAYWEWWRYNAHGTKEEPICGDQQLIRFQQ